MLFNQKIISFIIFYPIVLFSIVAHEVAHGYAAYLSGDPTAKFYGRLSLNPIKHIDPIGTLLLPFIMFISNMPMIGWAKPVPINILYTKNKRLALIFVSIAGPLANLLIILIITFLIRIIPIQIIRDFLCWFFYLNLALI